MIDTPASPPSGRPSSPLSEEERLFTEKMRARLKMQGGETRGSSFLVTFEESRLLALVDRLLAARERLERVAEAAEAFVTEYGETTMLVTPVGACDASSEALRAALRAARDQRPESEAGVGT